MMRGRTLAGLAVAVGVLAVPIPAHAALRWHRCAGGDECATGPGRLDGRLRAGDGGDEDDDLEYIVRGRLGDRPVRARLTFRSRLLLLLGVAD
jgi:hypothetical protein